MALISICSELSRGSLKLAASCPGALFALTRFRNLHGRSCTSADSKLYISGVCDDGFLGEALSLYGVTAENILYGRPGYSSAQARGVFGVNATMNYRDEHAGRPKDPTRFKGPHKPKQKHARRRPALLIGDEFALNNVMNYRDEHIERPLEPFIYPIPVDPLMPRPIQEQSRAAYDAAHPSRYVDDDDWRPVAVQSDPLYDQRAAADIPEGGGLNAAMNFRDTHLLNPEEPEDGTFEASTVQASATIQEVVEEAEEEEIPEAVDDDEALNDVINFRDRHRGTFPAQQQQA